MIWINALKQNIPLEMSSLYTVYKVAQILESESLRIVWQKLKAVTF